MSEKKVHKRKAQGAQTKQKLYEIAEKLFKERDYTDVSIEDITDAAGITKGAFYVHFESKDALIATLIADYASRVDTNYKVFLESLPLETSASDILIALSKKIADVLANEIGCENMKKVYQLLLAGTVDADAVKGFNRELYVLCENIFAKGIEHGEFKSNLPAEELSRHLVLAFRGISYEWCVRYPNFDLNEQVVEHVQLLLNGIRQ